MPEGGLPRRYRLRLPRRADVAALGAMHCRVWRETYADLMAREVIDGLTPEGFARQWDRWVDGAELPGADPTSGVLPTGQQVLIATHEDEETRQEEPVGFISLGPARDDHPPVDWQLWALNIVPEHQGTGLAHQLVAATLGDRPAYLWVATGNDRAIAFYRRHGFAEDGVRATDQHDGVTESRMVRPRPWTVESAHGRG